MSKRKTKSRAKRRPKARGKRNPFFAPEAVQYVAALMNPPAGAALFGGDNDVLYNPPGAGDERLRDMERQLQFTPDDPAMLVAVARERARRGISGADLLERLIQMCRVEDVPFTQRHDVLMLLVDQAEVEQKNVWLADILNVIRGRGDWRIMGSKQIANGLRKLLKKYGASNKDVSITVPTYANASAVVDVRTKTDAGRSAVEAVLASGSFRDAWNKEASGYRGGDPDDWSAAGPVILFSAARATADVMVEASGLTAPPKPEGEFKIGDVVKRRGKGAATKKKWIVSGFTIDGSGKRSWDLVAMSGSTKGSQDSRADGSEWELHPDQSKAFVGPFAHLLESAHHHHVQLHNHFHPDGYYSGERRVRAAAAAEPILGQYPADAYAPTSPVGTMPDVLPQEVPAGIRVWQDAGGDTLVQVDPTRVERLLATMRTINVTPSATFTAGVYSLGPADPAEVWMTLVGAGFEGAAPDDAVEGSIYLQNPGVKLAKKLASSGSLEALKSLIAEFYYSSADRIVLTDVGSHWQVQNGEKKVTPIVVRQGKRFVFGVAESSTNPPEVHGGPKYRAYWNRRAKADERLAAAQAAHAATVRGTNEHWDTNEAVGKAWAWKKRLEDMQQPDYRTNPGEHTYRAWLSQGGQVFDYLLPIGTRDLEHARRALEAQFSPAEAEGRYPVHLLRIEDLGESGAWPRPKPVVTLFHDTPRLNPAPESWKQQWRDVREEWRERMSDMRDHPASFFDHHGSWIEPGDQDAAARRLIRDRDASDPLEGGPLRTMGRAAAASMRRRRRGRSNPFFSPEAIQYVAAFANPPMQENPTKGAYDFASKAEQYAGYTDAQLRWAVRDAAEARDNMRGHDPAAEGWYADDVHTIAAELRKREGARGRRSANPMNPPRLEVVQSASGGCYVERTDGHAPVSPLFSSAGEASAWLRERGNDEHLLEHGYVYAATRDKLSGRRNPPREVSVWEVVVDTDGEGSAGDGTVVRRFRSQSEAFALANRSTCYGHPAQPQEVRVPLRTAQRWGVA